MFALRFRFPTGRYHATPWGRHVNEGAVAWPPEPWRILRALIATHHRKPPAGAYEAKLSTLIDRLSERLPIFVLPPAVHAHTRHYMPQGAIGDGREKTALVFDAFYRMEKDAEIVAAWPALDLPEDLFDLAGTLAGNLSYLGRAESLVEACADGTDWAFDENDPRIARPIAANGDVLLNREISDVVAPLSPSDYADALPRLREQAIGLKPAARRLAEACLPDTLLEALQIDTGTLRDAGWSRPPASRFVAYAHPRVGPSPPTRTAPARPVNPKAPTTARFLLAGAPAPAITETLPIGEVFRAALMARYTKLSGKPAPPVLSGRSETGAPLRDAQHGHAFFLPEDADGDGRIDHLVLHAAGGLDADVLSACAALTTLWIGDRGRSAEKDDTTDSGRREWHVALSQVGEIGAFAECQLLANSRTWESVTPYLRPWHGTRGAGPLKWCQSQILREVELRGLGTLSAIEFAGADGAHASGRNVLHFRRFRSRRGLVQPDRSGVSLRLAFESPVSGPIALGFGAHFGLGLFAAR